jgi:hypothetical protein
LKLGNVAQILLAADVFPLCFRKHNLFWNHHSIQTTVCVLVSLGIVYKSCNLQHLLRLKQRKTTKINKTPSKTREEPRYGVFGGRVVVGIG